MIQTVLPESPENEEDLFLLQWNAPVAASIHHLGGDAATAHPPQPPVGEGGSTGPGDVLPLPHSKGY